MVRLATINDLEEIVAIYNQAIRARFQTCFTQEFNTSDRVDWFNHHDDERHPLLVLETESKIKGWLSVSAYRPGRQALAGVVEISYFVDTNFRCQGVATALIRQAIDNCNRVGIKCALAILLDRNMASKRLLEKFGFEEWGHLPGIADFNGDSCGQYYYGLKIGS